MPDLTGLGEGALLNYLAGTTDAGEGGALGAAAAGRMYPYVPVGSYVTLGSQAPTASAPTVLNQLSYYQTYGWQSMTVSEVRIQSVAAAQAGAVWRFGFYARDESNGYPVPGRLIGEIGTVANAAATTVLTVGTGLSLTLPTGIFFLGVAIQGTGTPAGSWIGGAPMGVPMVTATARTSYSSVKWEDSATVSGALPTVAAPVFTNTTGGVPLLEVRRSG
jgi:hypothetical protein